MVHWAFILVIVLGILFACFIGWRRLAFGLFRIQPRRMTVKQLDLVIDAGPDEHRVNNILSAFAGGFNSTLVEPGMQAVETYCRSQPPLYRPFAEEGVAMGFIPRKLFRFDPAEFEGQVVRRRPEFRYLYYVGLGFWAGIRNLAPHKLNRMTERLDPLHGYLCFDGYGFARAFFHYRRNPQALQRLDLFEGYARNAAYQGVGRALFFLYMGDAETLATHIQQLGPFAADAAAGAGLAAAFVNPDRLEAAQGFAAALPSAWHDPVHLGLCFGLKARSINDVDQFERDMARLDKSTQEAVFASIRECDRIELLIRADGRPDGYRRWREAMTAWMTENVNYPLAGLRLAPHPSASLATDAASVPFRR